MAEDPVFIVGAPPSGTSLLRMLLNAHSATAIPGETSFFSAVYERFGDDRWEQAVAAFLTVCERALHPPVAPGPVRGELLSSAPDFARLLSAPLSVWAASQGKGRCGEKTPTHIFYVGEVLHLFPSARVVELLRDPRAVVASMNRFRWLGDDSAINARYWRDSATTGRARLRAHVPPSRLLTVRYEQLVAASDDTMQEVCDFVGVEFEPTMLDAHQHARSYLADGYSPKLLEPVVRRAGVGVRARRSRRGDHRVRVWPHHGLPRLPKGSCRGEAGLCRGEEWQHRDQRYHPVTYQPGARFRRSAATNSQGNAR